MAPRESTSQVNTGFAGLWVHIGLRLRQNQQPSHQSRVSHNAGLDPKIAPCPVTVPSVVARKVYISGALTGVPDLAQSRILYSRLAAAAASVGLRAYVPHERSDPEVHVGLSPVEVYRMDLAAIQASDIVVAWLGTPSLGVGAEVALAHGSGKSLVGVMPVGARVSRFILGMLLEGNSPVVELAAGDEDMRAVETALRRLARGEA